jgi:UbiA prenyltransferase family
VTPYALASALFVVSGYAGARALAGRSPVVDARAGLAWLTVLLVFFHLRVMDERKDARQDALLFPERPVPRGLVTLRELTLAGGVAVAAQLALNLVAGRAALFAWAGVLAFTGLMYREFFAGKALRTNFLLYTLAHLAVMPLLALYVYVVADVPLEPPFAFFLVWAYVAGLLFELVRKLQPGVHSYSSQLGVRGAAALVSAVAVAGAAAMSGLGVALGFGPLFHAGVWAAAAFAAAGAVRFGASASPERLRDLHAPVFVLAAQALVIAFAL